MFGIRKCGVGRGGCNGKGTGLDKYLHAEEAGTCCAWACPRPIYTHTLNSSSPFEGRGRLTHTYLVLLLRGLVQSHDFVQSHGIVLDGLFLVENGRAFLVEAGVELAVL